MRKSKRTKEFTNILIDNITLKIDRENNETIDSVSMYGSSSRRVSSRYSEPLGSSKASDSHFEKSRRNHYSKTTTGKSEKEQVYRLVGIFAESDLKKVTFTQKLG